MDSEIVGVRGHRFRLLNEIGRGGFGVVYRARDENERDHAVKVIAPVGDQTCRTSFEREIQSTIGLEHENILAIVDHGSFDHGEGDVALFVATPFCPEGDYRQTLRAYASDCPHIDKIIDDFLQVLAGLEMLHTRIVHRDLKPENVLISNGILKIADFGLSKFVDNATKTFTFKGLGTPRYMAPETWTLERATVATDL